MGKEPDEIRREIEDTRDRMGETVEAIGYRADVPQRARDSVNETKANVVESVRNAKERVVGSIVGTKESVGGSMSNAADSASSTATATRQSVADTGRSVATRVGEATPSAEDLRRAGQRGVGLAQENPLGLAIGSVALGFIAGLMVPATRVERQKIGPIADQVVEKARDTGQEALDRGKQVAEEAASTARQVAEETKDTAQEAAQQAAEDLKTTAQEQGQELASSARENAADVASSTSSSGPTGSTGSSDEPQLPTLPPLAESEIPPSGPTITGSDLIEGNTGIGASGPVEGHDPGGTPTV